jgi:hypothetical protein
LKKRKKLPYIFRWKENLFVVEDVHMWCTVLYVVVDNDDDDVNNEIPIPIAPARRLRFCSRYEKIEML